VKWKSGPSGPRQRREKKGPSPAGTAETPRELKTKAIGSIATRPEKSARTGTRHDGRFFFAAANAALEGPLFHGIIGGRSS